MLENLKLNLKKNIKQNKTEVEKYTKYICNNPINVLENQQKLFSITSKLNNSKQLFASIASGCYNDTEAYDVIIKLIHNTVKRVLELEPQHTSADYGMVEYRGKRSMLLNRLSILDMGFEYKDVDSRLDDMVNAIVFRF